MPPVRARRFHAHEFDTHVAAVAATSPQAWPSLFSPADKPSAQPPRSVPDDESALLRRYRHSRCFDHFVGRKVAYRRARGGFVGKNGIVDGHTARRQKLSLSPDDAASSGSDAKTAHWMKSFTSALILPWWAIQTFPRHADIKFLAP